MYALKMDVLEMQHSFGSHCETAACSPSICSTERDRDSNEKSDRERAIENEKEQQSNRAIESNREKGKEIESSR